MNTYAFTVDGVTEEYVFTVKYTGNGLTLTSNDVIMKLRAGGSYEFEITDADGDCLPDIYEHIMGTDPGIPNTEGDGLPDGYEVLRRGQTL
ncbi:MAG: hypothetical protein LBR54_03860 [Oscillospiraceae bacterium]|nr:hypothetical protein [Oscillospiraceae bacterium]